MIYKIKNKIEDSLIGYINKAKKEYLLKNLSAPLLKNMRDFILSDAKRIRPVLFVVSSLGFGKKASSDVYKIAAALELFHNFSLIHDDVIDNSDYRRNSLSMHRVLDRYVLNSPGPGGKELAIVMGDILYTMAIDCVLSSSVNAYYKQQILKKLIETAMRTGIGEWTELLFTLKPMEGTSRKAIYEIYDLKTSHYTFSTPLAIGGIFAKASGEEIEKVSEMGIYLGRAFQIRDDILDMFGKNEKIGKGRFTDLKEHKKTILLWYAHKKSASGNRGFLKKVFRKENLSNPDFLKICAIVENSGALESSIKDMRRFMAKAKKMGASIKMRPKYKTVLQGYLDKLLKLELSDLILSRPDKYQG